MTVVPDRYRFPLRWFDPRGSFSGAVRYSALDMAEKATGEKLPPESERRLAEREQRSQAHMVDQYAVARATDHLLAKLDGPAPGKPTPD